MSKNKTMLLILIDLSIWQNLITRSQSFLIRMEILFYSANSWSDDWHRNDGVPSEVASSVETEFPEFRNS